MSGNTGYSRLIREKRGELANGMKAMFVMSRRVTGHVYDSSLCHDVRSNYPEQDYTPECAVHCTSKTIY